MATGNQQIRVAQIDLNSVLNMMFLMIFMVMMFRMMDKALLPSEERPKLPPVKPPPGYKPLGRGAAAGLTEEERLQEKKMTLENQGRELARKASVEFLRLEEGWQSRYAIPEYWFRGPKGTEIIARDLEELKWKASVISEGHHSMWLTLEQRKPLEEKYGAVAVRWADEATRPGDIKGVETAAEYYSKKLKEALGMGHLSPEMTEEQLRKLRELLGLPPDVAQVLKIHRETGYIPC